MERILEYELEEEITIEKFLRSTLAFSKKQVSALKFRERGILVDGVKRRVSYVLRPGEHLTLTLEEECPVRMVPWHEKISILYEDEDVLAVDKPAGILVHPVGGHYGDTLANQVSAYFARKGEMTTLRAVGRLDKDTSGAVLFAKNRVAAARLSEKVRGFSKEYLALVYGRMEGREGSIDAPIGPWDRQKETALEKLNEGSLRMQVDFERGKEAQTDYQVLEVFEDCTLLRVRIATGRTHQIRVHMAYLDHPLLGDPIYGQRVKNHGFERTALHAGKLIFCRPFTGETVEVEAPLPKDFRQFLDKTIKRR